jgi:hypothetical protein
MDSNRRTEFGIKPEIRYTLLCANNHFTTVDLTGLARQLQGPLQWNLPNVSVNEVNDRLRNLEMVHFAGIRRLFQPGDLGMLDE